MDDEVDNVGAVVGGLRVNVSPCVVNVVGAVTDGRVKLSVPMIITEPLVMTVCPSGSLKVVWMIELELLQVKLPVVELPDPTIVVFQGDNEVIDVLEAVDVLFRSVDWEEVWSWVQSS